MKLLRKSNRRKSIFITILISYITILLFPVATGVYLFHQIEKIMVDNANRTNLGLLEQIKLVAENRFHQIDQMTVQVAFNPKLQLALSNIDQEYAKRQLDFVEIMESFKDFNRVNNSINDFMVYINNTDTVLTSTIKSDSSFFFNEMLVYNNKSPEWVKDKLFTGYQFKNYLPLTTIKEGETTSNVIPYIQSLPLGERENVKGYLVVFINEQEFDRLFNQIKKLNSSSIYIIDDRGQIIMSTSKDNMITSTELLAQLGNESGYNTINLNNNKTILSYTTDQNGWKYVSAVPLQDVLKQVMLVKRTALMLLLLILVSGVIASYVMTYRNYSPIRDVVRTILLENIHKREDEVNEFEFIKQSIIRTLGEKNQMKQTLKQHAPVIQANFLSRLIKGHIDVSALSEDSFTFMGIHFEHDYFAVIILEIENCKDFIKEDTEQEWAHVRFILSNLSIDLLGKQGYIVEMDRSRLAILLNVSTPKPHVHDDVAGIIENLLNVAVGRFNLQISIAVSQFNRGLKDIGKCYREALIALDYRMLKGSNTVIYHTDVAGYEKHYYHYQLEDEIQLIKFAKIGDYSSAERLLNQIYEANFLSNAISPEMGKFFMIDLLSTIVKIMNCLQIANKMPSESLIDPAKIIAESATAEEMFHKTKEIYRIICSSTSEDKPRHGDRLYFMICQYIDDHYNDNDMSLATMSNHFQISLQYLSTFFKKHNGENITDYIAAIRIREAKRLLSDPTITIGDIALRIGYANAVSFVRFFKKLEGMPPGKYREMLNR